MAGWTLVSGLAVLTYELAIAAAAGAGDAGKLAEHVLYPLVISYRIDTIGLQPLGVYSRNEQLILDLCEELAAVGLNVVFTFKEIMP